MLRSLRLFGSSVFAIALFLILLTDRSYAQSAALDAGVEPDRVEPPATLPDAGLPGSDAALQEPASNGLDASASLQHADGAAPPLETRESPSPSPAPRPDVRLAIGPGGLIGTWQSPNSDTSHSISGVAVQAELQLGGRVSPEVTVGGSVMGVHVPSPTAERADVGDVDSGPATAIVIGPFVEYQSSRPTAPRLQAGAGLAYLHVAESDEQTKCVSSSSGSGSSMNCATFRFPSGGDRSGFGASVFAGLGFDVPTSSNVRMGGMLRFVYIIGKVSRSEGSSSDYTVTAAIPSALFGVTFH